jgi:stringent starvation protein B
MMLSNKPYLIRAFYDWIVDSACTPLLVVNTAFPRCNVPKEYIGSNGEIVLNVSPHAIRDLKIGNDIFEFRASFSGVVHLISVPIKAILAVYAEENAQGMYFDYEDENSGSTEWDTSLSQQSESGSLSDSSETSIVNPKRPVHLKLVE